MGRTVYVDLVARVQGYVGPIVTSIAATKDLDKELQGLAKNHRESFDKITRSATVFGAGLVGAFALVSASAAGFDKKMSDLASVADTNAAGMGKLRAAAISAGQATVFSAGQAAEAETELAKAGLSVSDILGGGLTASLNLASAGSLGLADAATDTATAINQFELSGFQASHVTDLLAAGANKSATDVTGMAQALNQAGLVSHQTGLSIEQTTGTLAAMAQAGLHGSDAGTSLKTMLQALQAPSQITRDLMNQLGISAYDLSGRFVGITQLAAQLHDRLSNLTQAQRDQALAQIFGADAVRAANVLYEQGAVGIQGWIDKVNQQGAASDTARAKMDNLSGDLENLKGSIETVTIASGEGAQSGLRFLAQAATRAVNSFAVMPPQLAAAGTALGGAVGAATLAATGYVKLKAKTDELNDSLREMGPLGGKIATGLSSAVGMAGKLTVAFGILQAASAAFGDSISPQVSEVTKDLQQLAATGQATGVELQHLEYDISTIGSGAGSKTANAISGTIESLTGLGNVFDESLTHARERLADVDQGLAALVSSGNIDAAQNAFQQLYNIAHKQGISLADLNAALPNYVAAYDSYTAAQQNGAAAADGATGSQTALAGAVDDTGFSIASTTGDVKGLLDMLDRLNGAAASQMKAENDLQAAYDDASAAIKANGKTAIENHTILDAGTAKGRANRDALLGIADAANTAAQATLNQTGSAAAANKVLTDARGILIADAEKMGLSAQAANKLADELLSIPPTSVTTFSQPGMVKANDAALGYFHLINDIPSNVTTHFTVDVSRTGADLRDLGRHYINRWGGAYTHAADGALRQASISSAAVSGARYAYAEPGTGGELFVPKHGDYARSIGLLSVGASWYGQMLVPAWQGGRVAGGDGAATTYHNVTNVYPQRADFGVADLEQLDRVREVRQRVGRPG